MNPTEQRQRHTAVMTVTQQAKDLGELLEKLADTLVEDRESLERYKQAMRDTVVDAITAERTLREQAIARIDLTLATDHEIRTHLLVRVTALEARLEAFEEATTLWQRLRRIVTGRM